MGEFYYPKKSIAHNLVAEPFLLQVQKGLIPGHSIYIKYGSQYNLAADLLSDIWEFGGIEAAAKIYTLIADAGEELFISSSSALDNQNIKVSVNDQLSAREVYVDLVGQTKTPLETGTLFTAVNRMFNNNTVATVGNVYVYTDGTITDGVPDDPTKVKGFISPPTATYNGQQTKQAIFTVPRDSWAYLLKTVGAVAKKQAAAIIISSSFLEWHQTLEHHHVWRDQPDIMLNTLGMSALPLDFDFAPLSPGSTFKMGANSDSSGAGCSSLFEMLIVKGRTAKQL